MHSSFQRSYLFVLIAQRVKNPSRWAAGGAAKHLDSFSAAVICAEWFGFVRLYRGSTYLCYEHVVPCYTCGNFLFPSVMQRHTKWFLIRPSCMISLEQKVAANIQELHLVYILFFFVWENFFCISHRNVSSLCCSLENYVCLQLTAACGSADFNH